LGGTKKWRWKLGKNLSVKIQKKIISKIRT